MLGKGQYYYVDISHEGLKKHKRIKGYNKEEVRLRAEAQLETWKQMWERQQAAKQKKHARGREAKNKEEKKQMAIAQTNKAQDAINEIENTLKDSSKIDYILDWNSLLKYPKRQPIKPTLKKLPPEPPIVSPDIKVADYLIYPLRRKKIQEANASNKRERMEWEGKKNDIEEENKSIMDNYQAELLKWKNAKDLHAKRFVNLKETYFDKAPSAINDYCELVLSHSKYPNTFPQEFNLDYNPESKILLIDYLLPSKENIPTLNEVKYIASEDKFKEKHLSESATNNLYDDLLYQITLRTIHELYEADLIDAISSIVLNGYVKFIDKSTGQEVTPCILSIQTKKDEFIAINLANVEPKACFKKLKGVGSSKLHGLAPVAPIMKIDRRDKRFVSHYDVANSVDESVNIAAMDWKDFENLIRELFEKEFTTVGGEVKITQASRDGGVDAVAFDPDPIRGGKIVIQAKRYTNVVGVAAVRDLYGTVVNEGAIKGILVTTADYGPDAYQFSKDKPITLLSGSNLLHLLEKHGHKAKIDLKEAKKILAEK